MKKQLLLSLLVAGIGYCSQSNAMDVMDAHELAMLDAQTAELEALPVVQQLNALVRQENGPVKQERVKSSRWRRLCLRSENNDLTGDDQVWIGRVIVYRDLFKDLQGQIEGLLDNTQDDNVGVKNAFQMLILKADWEANKLEKRLGMVNQNEVGNIAQALQGFNVQNEIEDVAQYLQGLNIQ